MAVHSFNPSKKFNVVVELSRYCGFIKKWSNIIADHNKTKVEFCAVELCFTSAPIILNADDGCKL